MAFISVFDKSLKMKIREKYFEDKWTEFLSVSSKFEDTSLIDSLIILWIYHILSNDKHRWTVWV